MPLQLNFFAPYRYKNGIIKTVNKSNESSVMKINNLLKNKIISNDYVHVMQLIEKYRYLTAYQIRLMMKQQFIYNGEKAIRIPEAISLMIKNGILIRSYIDYTAVAINNSNDMEISKEDEELPDIEKSEKRSVYFYSLSENAKAFLGNKLKKENNVDSETHDCLYILETLSTNQFIAEYLNIVKSIPIISRDIKCEYYLDSEIIKVNAAAFIRDKEDVLLFNCRRNEGWDTTLKYKLKCLPEFRRILYGEPNSLIKPIILVLCEDTTQVLESYDVVKKELEESYYVVYTTDTRVVDEYFNKYILCVKENKEIKDKLELIEILSPLTN